MIWTSNIKFKKNLKQHNFYFKKKIGGLSLTHQRTSSVSMSHASKEGFETVILTTPSCFCPNMLTTIYLYIYIYIYIYIYKINDLETEIGRYCLKIYYFTYCLSISKPPKNPINNRVQIIQSCGQSLTLYIDNFTSSQMTSCLVSVNNLFLSKRIELSIF